MRGIDMFAVLLVCILCSCEAFEHQEVLLPELQHAESLMYSLPDSAMSILEMMPKPAPSEQLQYATWCLLLVQARDKNHIVHTSDSLINIAYDYFMMQENVHRKALVLNYEGRVNEDMEEIEKATSYYLQAQDVCKETDDFRLDFLIKSNLGTLFLYRSMYKEALEVFQEVIVLAYKIDEPGYISASYSYLGRVYSIIEMWNEAIASYKKAIYEAEISEEKSELSRALGELAAVYEVIEKYDSSFFYLKKDEDIIIQNGLNGISQTYLSLGSLYSLQEDYETAMTYLHKSLLSYPNLYTKKSAYEELAKIFEILGNDKEAFNYLKFFLEVQDTILQHDKYKEVAEIQARYNHEKLKSENSQLKFDKERNAKMSLSILFVLFVLLFCVILAYQRKLLSKERVIQEKKAKLVHYTVQLHENKEVIRNNENRIQLLMKDLNVKSDREEEQDLEIKQLNEQNVFLENENVELQKSIEETDVLLRQKNELMQAFQVLSVENERLSKREIYLYDKLTKQIPVLNELLENPQYITERQWKLIKDAVELLYGNFTERLLQYIPDANKNDIRFCYLIKLHFSNSIIASLTMVTTPAVTKHKQRLKKQLPQEVNEKLVKNNSFEDWLMKL